MSYNFIRLMVDIGALVVGVSSFRKDFYYLSSLLKKMPVDYRLEKIMMGTQRIIGEDPLPRFFEYYPYTGLNDFDEDMVPISYDSIVVENEYLKMRVIPSLGARLYDLYDKVNDAHVFHYNEKVRPVMIALRGAWISTGMEFNSLDRPHHTVDNFSQVDYDVKREDDGSVTVHIGNLNLLTDIYWLVGLTLRPGRQFLETNVRLFNNGPLYNKYYFWTNTAESVTDGSRIFIPGKRTQYGPFPIFDGVDVSWYKNCKYAVDAFIIDCEEDFFGYYDYNLGQGVVQYANHFIVPGKKRFTWGTSEDGLFWTPILSDKGMPYIELQSGRFRTQGVVEFMDPHFFEEWREWWYPIAKIGGISLTNKDATVYVNYDTKGCKALIGIYVTKEIPASRIRVRRGDETLEEAFDLSPGHPFIKTYATKRMKTEVEVIDGDGNEVITWDCRNYRTKTDDSVFQVPVEFTAKYGPGEDKGQEGLWSDAMIEEKRGKSLLAELKYKRLLEQDEDSRGLCALAVMYYRQGRTEEAIDLLERATKRLTSYEDALYYVGLCYLNVGRYRDSEMALWKARRSAKYFTTASHYISLIRVRNNEYEEAVKIITEGLQRNGRDLKCLFLYAATLRRLGRMKEALEVAKGALNISPLYYPALCERMLSSKGMAEFDGAESDFKRVVLACDQKVRDVACEYMCTGLYDEAEEILRGGILSGLDGPMIHYYLGFVLERLGRMDERDKEYGIGNSKQSDYVFPHRLEEETILRSAKDASGDPKPIYYLGNLLFSLKRFKEGVREWESAEERGMRHPILHRNLGYAYHRVYRLKHKALRQYEKAIELDPTNHHLYLEYYDVCSQLGLVNKGVEILEIAKGRIKKDSILARLSSAYVDAGRYEEALDILRENTFTPAEGYFGNWETFVEAHIRRGVKRMTAKECKGAMEDLMDALRYPINLGAGVPYRPHRHEAMQRYWLGECYFRHGRRGKARETWRGIFEQRSFTPQEVYYQGLGLKALGRREEANGIFKGTLKSALQKEVAIMGLKDRIPLDYFNFLNYDYELAAVYCTKMIAYLGLGRMMEASKEFTKALRITKDLGHYKWISDSFLGPNRRWKEHVQAPRSGSRSH